MATFTRRNAWNNNGTFDNSDLLWYAKGVKEMQSRTLADPNSWWFFAAIHGQYVTNDTNSGTPPPTTFPNWGKIPPAPNVPTTPLPSADLKSKYWDQCQHQSWYFAPWHRGYLVALEAQIRAAIVSLGGPKDWALPYWNYFGPNDEYKMPPAFAAQNLPDGTANPLFVKARYGPNRNGVIFIGIPPVSQKCQTNTVYTGSNSSTPSPGYGGPNTGFSNAGAVSGNLESNPHNQVHGDVGGFISNLVYGLMSDPGTAALDPIFYLHHCNIDRLWASWNADGNSNPKNASWLAGPAANGERAFIMPLPGGKPWVYTPADVNSLSQMDYDYQQLLTSAPANILVQRLRKLGVDSASIKANIKEAKDMDLGANSELVGANDGTLQLKTSGVRTTVNFESKAWEKVPKSLMKASASSIPDRVYLQLENVKGNMDANFLTVSVNQKNVGRISLFGLRKASMKEGHHGGSGITFLLDITDTIDSLHIDNALDANSLDVVILPNNEIPEEENITIDRVSVYREGR
jgi:tyrosinase